MAFIYPGCSFGVSCATVLEVPSPISQPNPGRKARKSDTRCLSSGSVFPLTSMVRGYKKYRSPGMPWKPQGPPRRSVVEPPQPLLTQAQAKAGLGIAQSAVGEAPTCCPLLQKGPQFQRRRKPGATGQLGSRVVQPISR